MAAAGGEEEAQIKRRASGLISGKKMSKRETKTRAEMRLIIGKSRDLRR